LVNGKKPILIDLADPHWEAKLPSDTLGSGVYIVRTKGGQILKPGDTSDLAGRMSTYRRWLVEDGIDVTVDFYPMRADHMATPPVRLQRVANDIRTKLETDGWNLPRDWENIGPNPPGYRQVKVTRVGE
jgi:hypothetical protein